MDTDQIEFLNPEVHWQDIIGIPIRNDIPKELQSYLQKLVERTVPIISIIFPDDYCWQWVGAIDKDGYAKHRIPGGYKGSTLVHRFIYQVAPKRVNNRSCMWKQRLYQSQASKIIAS